MKLSTRSPICLLICSLLIACSDDPGTAAGSDSVSAPGVGHVTRINISSGRPWEDTAGYSRAVRAGDLFVTSLTSPSAPDGTILYPGDVYRQTREALTIIGDALAEAGLSYADVIKTHIYMRDTARWAEAGRAHAEVFDAVRPALSFIGVSGFFDPRIDVEVEVLAVAAAED